MHQFREPCIYCSRLSDSECPRCHAPLCRRHLPEQVDRCQRCERQFELVRLDAYTAKVAGSRSSRAVRMALGIALVPVSGVLLTKSLATGNVVFGIITLVGTALIGAVAFSGRRLSRRQTQLLRRKFLDEREKLPPSRPEFD